MRKAGQARAISAVMRLLRRRPCTASDVARLLNVSRVTAYKWIGYARRAAQVQTRTEEYGERGRGQSTRLLSQNGTSERHAECDEAQRLLQSGQLITMFPRR